MIRLLEKMQRINFSFFIVGIALTSVSMLQANESDKSINHFQTNSPDEIASTNPALDRVLELNDILSNPEISHDDKLKYSKELFGVLSYSGAALKAYGPLCDPITSISHSQLPITDEGSIISPDLTAWQESYKGFYPTNDWFEQLAVYPKSTTSNSTGVYKISYNSNGSLNYNVPQRFIDHQDPDNLAQGWIEQVYDNGFTIDSQKTLNPHPFAKWEEYRVGNLVRHLVYKNVSYYVAQGSVFQTAYFASEKPIIGLCKPDRYALMTHETLESGIQKYRIETSQQIYLFYGNNELNLIADPILSKYIASENYSGLINAASIPINQRTSKTEKLLDTYANSAIVRGQGTVLKDGEYEFTYMCHDLRGSPTSEDPLVFLKDHHISSLLTNGLNEPTAFARIGLLGRLTAYRGSSFCFKASLPKTSTRAIPYLPNGDRGITFSQAMDVITSGWLEKGLSTAYNFKPSNTVYEGGKGLYQISLTLAYAQEVMEAAGRSNKEISRKLHGIYEKIKKQITLMWQNFEFDSAWGTIVPKGDDYGAHRFMNDHIAQYGYTIYSLALLHDFENQYVSEKNRFINQKVNIQGLENYTNRDICNFLAADIGQTGKLKAPLYRNFDIYNGHSWLSGIGGPVADGNNTESQSEVVFGSLAIAAWLERTQPRSIKASFANTRWAIETQALNTYFHIGDPLSSVYGRVAPSFARKHPVISMLWDNKACAETYWGNNWDRILACETMPAGANLMDNYLNNNPDFAQRACEYILTNWKNFDSENNIQSVLIAIVARTRPAAAQWLIRDLENQDSNYFDSATNSFILYMTTLYAANEKLFDY